jgi:NAD+ synthase (glutamine-hydrolysing)
MAKKLRIVLAQLNLTVGDIEGNLKKYKQAAIRARDELAADVIVFPELGLTGYPAEDLYLRPAFIQREQLALQQLIAEITGIHCVLSHTYMNNQQLFNACSLVYNNTILGRYAKQHLPNYGVFDEDRYFVSGNGPCVVPIQGVMVGLVVCEDLWVEGPTQQAASHGARLILSPNASPFEIDKHEKRMAVLAKRAALNRTPIVYVNNVGGQDELIFDGGSMVITEEGQIAQFAGFFNETLLPVDIDISPASTKIAMADIQYPSREEKIYQALVLALRDYVEKNRFQHVLLGLSGGIDSALTLAIAVDALGKDRVKAIIMPSRYTADISLEDAAAVAKNLGVKSETISIEPTYKSFLETLAPSFAGKKTDVTEQNIQARCRAVILMALSNKFNALVLTTGNRSELAVGYCTLYGDMAGGFAVLKDVPKTLVTQLVLYRNRIQAVIPQRIIDRPPTAELAENQKDEDTIPPYPVLDGILERYLGQTQSIDEIVTAGFDRDTVQRVVKLIHQNEYKRRQSAIGPRINEKSFGKDWRYPVTGKFE